MPLTEAQIAYEREPISYKPVKRLERGPLYVRVQDIPHPIYGYSQYHKEYSVIDLRGYRKGMEPRLEILGVYTPHPSDFFRIGTGRLPAYQPTATGDKLQAEMERLNSFHAWRILPSTLKEKTHKELTFLNLQKLFWTPGELAEYPMENLQALRKEVWKAISISPFDTSLRTMDDLLRKAIRYKLREKKEEKPNYLETPPPSTAAKEPWQIPFEFYNTQYSLKQLQEIAKTAGLSPSGLKQDLINRLVQKGVLK